MGFEVFLLQGSPRSIDSTKELLVCDSGEVEEGTEVQNKDLDIRPSTDLFTTTPTGAAKEPIYSDLGQAPKGGATKLPQSEATVQYADINTIVPKQRATQSYDDVVVTGTGTTVIGGGPTVPLPVPAKGGESKPPPLPKKTKGAATTQMETEETVAARNLPHHVGDGKYISEYIL